MEIKSSLKTLAIVGALSSATTLGAYKLFLEKSPSESVFTNTPSAFTRLVSDTSPVPAGAPGDFTYAAEKATPAVVHIKTKMTRNVNRQMMDPFEDFFGGGSPFGGGGGRRQPEAQEASGSGVIISADGYIVTNNHVVQDADEVSVILNDKRELKAKVISTDPSTDIAVIQIKSNGLPFLTFGDSDAIRVGEWVLAVGNPFNLESTVTAGIISAKGRQNIIDREKDVNPLESFIQTDAAVNPGNSGGALVNLKGELIGINTAIASPNGAYAGYAFAVPSEIVKKVTADIVKYGNVQRGYLGISLVELDSKKADEFNTKTDEGIYVADIVENGGAEAAGIKKGDVIVKIDGMETKSGPKLQEIIGRKRPGEITKVSVNRNGSLKDFDVTLRNRDGGKDIVKNTVVSENKVFEQLGIELAELSSTEKQKMGLQNGVVVKKIFEGTIADYTQMREGFVVTKVGEKRINSASDFKAAVKEAKSSGEEGVMICGTYQSSSRTTCYGLSLE